MGRPVTPRQFTITLRAEPGVQDPVRELKALLKVALRQHGLKCLLCAPEDASQFIGDLVAPGERRYQFSHRLVGGGVGGGHRRAQLFHLIGECRVPDPLLPTLGLVEFGPCMVEGEGEVSLCLLRVGDAGVALRQLLGHARLGQRGAVGNSRLAERQLLGLAPVLADPALEQRDLLGRLGNVAHVFVTLLWMMVPAALRRRRDVSGSRR
jgi:hypothetical protein